MDYAIEVLKLAIRMSEVAQWDIQDKFGYESSEYKETATKIESMEKAISILEAN